MKKCLECQSPIPPTWPKCPRCGSFSFYISASEPQAEAPRKKFLVGLAVAWSLFCLVLSGVFILKEKSALTKIGRELAAERVRLMHEQEERFKTEAARIPEQMRAAEEELQIRLQNRPLVSGALAFQRRQGEWNKRLAHDPAFARSGMEANLLEMERLGRDPSLQAKLALERAARIGSPAGSRVEVSPLNNQYHVQVAFRMSALSQQESGAVTKHHTTDSMRLEIQQLSAQVIKDLYDSCGTRGIELLSVSCNHAITRSLAPRNATPAELAEFKRRARVVMSSVYRVSIDKSAVATIADLRKVPSWKLIQLLKVEKDTLSGIEIERSSLPLHTVDPNVSLEF
jgi:hypothetical protein